MRCPTQFLKVSHDIWKINRKEKVTSCWWRPSEPRTETLPQIQTQTSIPPLHEHQPPPSPPNHRPFCLRRLSLSLTYQIPRVLILFLFVYIPTTLMFTKCLTFFLCRYIWLLAKWSTQSCSKLSSCWRQFCFACVHPRLIFFHFFCFTKSARGASVVLLGGHWSSCKCRNSILKCKVKVRLWMKVDPTSCRPAHRASFVLKTVLI